jgi:outer membrane lipoprotein SlyB
VNRLIIGIGAFLGSTIGGYVPVIWGGSMFSLISIFFGVAGGIAGVIIGYRISKHLGFI